MLMACNSNNASQENTSAQVTPLQTDTATLAPIDTVAEIEHISPEVFAFKYSECQESCNDYEHIISKRYAHDTLWLKVASIENCIANFRLELKESGDTLDLNIRVQEKIIKRENGDIDTLVTMLTCDCFFYFTIGIKNIQTPYKTILLEGKHRGRTNNIPEEPEIKDTMDRKDSLDGMEVLDTAGIR